jgi:uncharacterized protein YndB with AHSA1/START domain
MTETEPAAAADYTSRIHIQAPPEAVFRALTTVTGVAGWWGPASGSGAEGGELRLAFSFDEPQVFHVDIAKRPTAVVWTVREGSWLPDWTGTTISFQLSAGQPDGCELNFRHQGLTPKLECYGSCSKGWDQVLPSLRDYVETGSGSPWGGSR